MNKESVLAETVTSDGDENILRAVECFNTAIGVIRKEYMRRHNYPWIVAYSGGKDSTLLLQMTWEVLASLPSSARHRKVYVVGNDTLVESPLVIRHMRNSMKKIAEAAIASDLPIETKITTPNVDQTFWVNVIGRGYIPPTRNFRWCTDRMKIIPTNRLLEKLIRSHKRAVLLVGTRKSESTNRRRNMEKHGISGTTMSRHSTIPTCRMFAPIAEFKDEDVWITLIQRKPPWGGTHRDLITLYRNAGGGECPLVLTKEDAPSCGTTSPRFGCWTCTVVNKDRSLRGLIDSGHNDANFFESLYDFREWLVELRENNSNRQSIRRNGISKTRADGTPVFGPFTLDVRKQILDQLRELEQYVGECLITEPELEFIYDIWRRDEVTQLCRDELHNAVSPKSQKS
ncbi:MAG: DNA phosphorothioation system sulfurtransferase DndC [Candidatus Dadabacteria bacterium]|nr:DNA phosphorothioation system sulfurtransferase DndC [Candidatus Dadabacteria bacterium]MYA47963.1 DNA phosphorothioation system sulfurtransferase DndC [Candidatus Dadabacteria bacterium]MYF47577.1 DNA phosphorothioation system sulfurtransferase DndC [Candidatus Dadabacteria bacterium]MYG82849.1 DNA phosphorothioation system sulfurtransferase DndC [Candidatus Dadabacteria bacterium]MYK49167.1 DNA phosphorothioation system sulfurtransferase DndC [Candidatus Dadabacteria bacterium]